MMPSSSSSSGLSHIIAKKLRYALLLPQKGGLRAQPVQNLDLALNLAVSQAKIRARQAIILNQRYDDITRIINNQVQALRARQDNQELSTRVINDIHQAAVDARSYELSLNNLENVIFAVDDNFNADFGNEMIPELRVLITTDKNEARRGTVALRGNLKTALADFWTQFRAFDIPFPAIGTVGHPDLVRDAMDAVDAAAVALFDYNEGVPGQENHVRFFMSGMHEDYFGDLNFIEHTVNKHRLRQAPPQTVNAVLTDANIQGLWGDFQTQLLIHWGYNGVDPRPGNGGVWPAMRTHSVPPNQQYLQVFDQLINAIELHFP